MTSRLEEFREYFRTLQLRLRRSKCEEHTKLRNRAIQEEGKAES